VTAVSKTQWRDAGRDQKLALVEQAYGRSPVLYVETTILVHDLTKAAADALASVQAGEELAEAPDSSPCPCCGSKTARIVESRKDLALFIDRDTGRRVLASKLSAVDRAKVIAAAEHVPITLRVSRAQLPLLLAPKGKHILASGSHRSGKTQVGAYWLARQWLLRGGRRAQFWIVGPTQFDAFRVLQKMVYGDDSAPPILPASLFTYLPATERMALQCRMVDGSLLDLKHLQERRGGNLKREAVQAILVDEAGEMSTVDQLTTLEGRLLTTKGSLFLATTPTVGSFLKEQIVDKCREYAELSGEARTKARHHRGTRWMHVSLQVRGDQPWVDPVFVHNEIMSKGGESDPSVQRDYFGCFVSNAGPLWREFSLEDHVIRNEYRELAEWHEWRDCDITPTVARRLFGTTNPLYRGLKATNHAFIGGADVNVHPMTTCILQVAADKAEPTNKDKWTIFVWDCVQTQHGNSYKHAEALNSFSFARVMRPDAKGPPCKGIGIIVDATALGRDPTAHTFGGDPKGLVDVFGKLGFDLRPPCWSHNRKPAPAPKSDSYLLVHRLLREGRLLIHERCHRASGGTNTSLIAALLGQEDSGDGVTPIKVSSNASDRLSSSVDALRYALWSVFHGGQSMAVLVDGAGMLR